MKKIKFYSIVGFALIIWGAIFGGIPIGLLSRNIGNISEVTNETFLINCFMKLYIPTLVGTIIFYYNRNILSLDVTKKLWLASCGHILVGGPAFIMFLIDSFCSTFGISFLDNKLYFLYFSGLSISLVIGLFQISLLPEKFDKGKDNNSNKV